MPIRKPLEGIRVVELATFVAVPMTGRILADMGAEVIKVEAPAGDPLRYTAKNEGRPEGHLENTSFDLDNAGKKAIAIDLKRPEGLEVLFKLLDGADVFLTNLRTKALLKLGIDYESLRAKYPALVYAQITGYGESGPDKDLPGYDFTAFFARGGWTGALYEPDSKPMTPVQGLGDHQAGMYLVAGINAALLRAKLHGEGEKVTVSLLHSAIFGVSLMLTASQYGFPGGKYPQSRRMAANPFLTAYRTQDDRFIQVSLPAYNADYNRMMTALGRADMCDHPVFAKQQTVGDRMPELYDIVSEALASRTLSEWAEIFTKADIPFSVAQTWDELLRDEQAWASGCFCEAHYPTGNTRTMVQTPVMFQESGAAGFIRAPYLGEHTRELLGQLGYDEIGAAKLLEAKAVAQWED